ncbi:MAG: bifunctional 4-hydroxy-2-oxoglutarate aldolase/2-dehydro-3-deoxy-phosphogluconate aldolase [Propionibacteriaceae bacterium]|jgi:2-dehydro-3-deoxyphosphogluconate aldolase/(4S)-4-hydroxy-2-oxoglutarate aldolase|nr:bifunctional 4-hydroxy-2-oxoglutarate aldolase/2-dehydro-3-deoxy-phosphogluconate aldolase [Propionibacteriaceae bacterium]
MLNQIRQIGVVPVVVLDDPAAAQPLADALVAGGIPAAEITFRTAAGAAAIAEIAGREDILVGAGTVLTPQQVDAAADAGARFIVSPGFSRAVVERTLDRGLLSLPGAVTATEIQAALELGLNVVKFFPAEVSGGIKAIKAFAGPFADVSFIPTGGVSAANLAEYLAVKQVAACGGSWMVPRDAIAGGDFARVTQLCREAAAIVAAAR